MATQLAVVESSEAWLGSRWQLANLDLVALLLRNRPPLPNDAKRMREEVRGLLARSAIHMNSRELAVLCNLLRQQQGDTRDSQGLDVLPNI